MTTLQQRLAEKTERDAEGFSDEFKEPKTYGREAKYVGKVCYKAGAAPRDEIIGKLAISLQKIAGVLMNPTMERNSEISAKALAELERFLESGK